MTVKKAMTFATRILIFFVVLFFVAIGVFFWWNDGLSPVDPSETEKTQFIIKKGEAVNSIASRLAAERLIRSKTVFYVYLKFSGLDSKIQAGNFHLQPSMSIPDVAQELTTGTVDVWVTLLEGWRVEEIAQKLSTELGIPEAEFLSHAKEGYMFPDTYLLPKDASASAIAQIMRNTFDKRIRPELLAEIQKQGRTLEDVVILASILEREGKTEVDRPIIAGILLKRLENNWPLEVDASLQYALGYQGSQQSWWKKGLTQEDKSISSAYNTYAHQGLPPGPIANPGLISLNAAVNPQESPYWFYLHAPDGQIYYGETLEAHNANVEKYLR